MSQRQTVEFAYPMWTIVEATEGLPGMLQGYIVRQRVEYRPIMPPIIEYLIAMPESMVWIYEADVIVATSPNRWAVAAARPQEPKLEGYAEEPQP